MASQRYAWVTTACQYDLATNPASKGLLVVAIVDVIDPGAVEAAFVQLGAHIEQVEREDVPAFGDEVMYTTLVFGMEPSDFRAEEVHNAYNRIWERSPHLWESIERRMRPTSFWFVAEDGRPFQGFIQPAADRSFEMIGAADVRSHERFRYYREQLGDRWAILLSVLGPDFLASAQEVIRDNRA